MIDKVMHNKSRSTMLGHKFRILEILVTKYPILYTIETVVLPVCPSADTQSQTPDCSTRLLLLNLGPSSIHKSHPDTFLPDLLQ